MISNLGWLETQKPPTVPTLFEKVPMMKSQSSITPAAPAETVGRKIVPLTTLAHPAPTPLSK